MRLWARHLTTMRWFVRECTTRALETEIAIVTVDQTLGVVRTNSKRFLTIEESEPDRIIGVYHAKPKVAEDALRNLREDIEEWTRVGSKSR